MDLCTVISERYIPQAINLIQSYKVYSYNENIFVYYFNTSIDKLEIFKKIFGDQVKLVEVENKVEHAHNPRVFFYKVYAINDCLTNHSGAMIYSDSANCFIKEAKNIEKDLIDDSLFLAYPYEKLTNQYWTTEKCLELAGSIGAEIMPQYWAGFQAYKRTPKNIALTTEMYDYMLNPEMALPDMSVKYPDGKDSSCIEHRCDQSILSILIHKHNRHQSFDPIKNSKYGDWQTFVEFDREYNHDFDNMILSPRESKFNNFRFLREEGYKNV